MSEMNSMVHDQCKIICPIPLQIVTILGTKEKQEVFANDSGILKFHSLDPEKNLVEQWNNLNSNKIEPDLFLAKISKTLLLNLHNNSENSNSKVSHLRELWQLKRENINDIEVLPLESQILLSDRYEMQCLIKTVCSIVNCFKSIKNNGSTNCSPFSPACKYPASHKLPSFISVSDNYISGLPSFPLVIKPICTENKQMAIVTNIMSLQHFRRTVCRSVVVEEYIPHNDTILKIGLIGKDIFVIRRPSIPNLLDHNKESLVQLSIDLMGEFVHLDVAEGGYVTFKSMITKRRECYSSNKLDNCDDLDQDMVKMIVSTVSRILRLELLGVDILISNRDKSMFIIDINIFPGFKNIQEKEKLLTGFLIEEATKRMLKCD